MPAVSSPPSAQTVHHKLLSLARRKRAHDAEEARWLAWGERTCVHLAYFLHSNALLSALG